MNTPSIATVRQLHALVSAPNPSPSASSAWRLLLTMHGPHATLDEMAAGWTMRIPERSLIEYVKVDQFEADLPSAVSLMRDGIADGLSAVTPGKGSRARRRIDALNMGARRKCRMPAAPAPAHHLNCA